MARPRNEKVVVIGLGRMGAALATQLTRRGLRVLAVDSDAAVVQSLSAALPHVVQADATDRESLVQLDVHEMHRAVIAIGEGLEASILATSLVAELGVKEIWAKATGVQHARILRRMGADHVVLPEQEAGERLSHVVAGSMQDFLTIDDDYAFVTLRAPASLVGQTLGGSGLRRDHGVTVVAVRRSGGSFTYAEADTRIEADDTLVVSGANDAVEKFSEHR
ncbi:MAG: TrkA family potassium uptake protein [Terracoccus sp.]